MSAKKKRSRKISPPYPSVGLKTCMIYMEKLHKYAGQSEVTKENALKYLGLDTAKGLTNRVYDSITNFKLINERQAGKIKHVSVSQLARKILLAKGINNLVKTTALQTAALNFEIIRKLRNRWSDGLPEDDSIYNVLVFDHKYRDRAAKSFIPTLKETYSYAKLGDDDLSVNQIVDVPENDVEIVAEPDKEIGNSPSIMESKKGLSGFEEYKVSIGKSKEARLFLSNNLNDLEFEFMISWINQLDIRESSPDVSDNDEDEITL